MKENLQLKGIVYVSISGLLWSLVVIALKVSVVEINPITIVWFRFTLSFLLLGIFFLIKKRNDLKILIKPPLILIFASLALIINYIGIILGVHYTSPSTTQIIIQFGPILFALAGFRIFKEKIVIFQGIGFLVALFGLGLFYAKQSTVLINNIGTFNKGIIWTFISATGWAIYATLQKIELKRNTNAQQLNLIIYGLPVLVCLPFVDFSIFTKIDFSNWMLLIFLGLNTLISYGFLSAGMKYIEASVASVVISLNPIVTFILMQLFTYYKVSWIEAENFTLISYIGAGLVILGAIMVVKFNRKSIKNLDVE